MKKIQESLKSLAERSFSESWYVMETERKPFQEKQCNPHTVSTVLTEKTPLTESILRDQHQQCEDQTMLRASQAEIRGRPVGNLV